MQSFADALDVNCPNPECGVPSSGRYCAACRSSLHTQPRSLLATFLKELFSFGETYGHLGVAKHIWSAPFQMPTTISGQPSPGRRCLGVTPG